MLRLSSFPEHICLTVSADRRASGLAWPAKVGTRVSRQARPCWSWPHRLHCTRASDWPRYLVYLIQPIAEAAGPSVGRRWELIGPPPVPARASLDVTSTNRELAGCFSSSFQLHLKLALPTISAQHKSSAAGRSQIRLHARGKLGFSPGHTSFPQPRPRTPTGEGHWTRGFLCDI